MRIALVSPYSWTYQGGVNRHVEALAEQFIDRGDHVRVLAPWDPPDAISRRLHRSHPELREAPDYLVPLGRTMGFGANGAISNLSVFPHGPVALRRELRVGNYDVVHLHEPLAPLIGWDAMTFRGAPVVGTFHAYSTKAFPNHLASLLGARRRFNQLAARIAVSEAAAWTGRRWFGGEYTIIPNGVDIEAAPRGPKPASDQLRLLFVGRAEERKGLPVLLSAFQALVEQVPSRLTVVGADPEEISRRVADPDLMSHIDVLGKVSDSVLWRQLGEADILCAPSLAGESFGMVLIEAMAAGTAVIASKIAGYSDVVTNGVDGILVPPADPQALAEELQLLAYQPERLVAMGEAGRRSAERYAWPRIAEEVSEVYEHAIEPAPAPVMAAEAAARRTGLVRIDGGARQPAKRLPSLEPSPVDARSRSRRVVRKAGVAAAGILGLVLTALAARRIGVDQVATSIINSDVKWVVIAFVLMVGAMFARAASWIAIVRAALPGRQVRRRDVTSATMIGVLMSATLPARLGEPARAMVLSRHIGRMRETFPVLIGTLVSQTALNIFALALLGGIIVSTTDLFQTSTQKLFLVSMAPLVVLLAVLMAPSVVRVNGQGRIARGIKAVRGALQQARKGLTVFRDLRKGSFATGAQLFAWFLQLASCWALFAALGLNHQVSIGAAAACLFAVNVTAVVPATPSNIGIFQLAIISVLNKGFGVPAADALAYGVILQAVEIATAVVLGVPALIREGVTWSDMRLRAMSAAPVELPERPAERKRSADRISA
ncbi:MAG: phosphatidyl-myo-inositol alpha-mannosyltransferase [Solirubrobacterales bacterium]|nr:phosphatidyl-myo-inositol alpha-mannosyltransferase [Solirubrobacterales bacterium]